MMPLFYGRIEGIDFLLLFPFWSFSLVKLPSFFHDILLINGTSIDNFHDICKIILERKPSFFNTFFFAFQIFCSSISPYASLLVWWKNWDPYVFHFFKYINRKRLISYAFYVITCHCGLLPKKSLKLPIIGQFFFKLPKIANFVQKVAY